jgi:serine phosphatase RsbU (regulator of sigma subunit)
MVNPAHLSPPGRPVGEVVAALTAMAVISGRDHRVTYADQLLRRWIGEGEPVGRGVHDVVGGLFDLPDLDRVVDGCLRTGEPYQVLRPLQARIGPAGRTGGGFVRLTFAPLPRTGADGMTEIVMVVTDCTDQVLAQRQQERGAVREQVLLRLATASNEVSSMEAKLVAIANSAVPVVSDVCAINLLDQPLPAGRHPAKPITMWRLAAPTSDGQIGPVAGQKGVWCDGDPASAAIAAGRTVVYHYDPNDPPAWAARAGVERAIRVGRVHCTAMVPVAFDGHVHAVVAFGAGPRRAAYDEDDVELFELIAAQSAVAMRQGGVFDTVRSAALTLQRAMLSPPPLVEGLDIAVRYRPAGKTAEVGGDWYDVFPLADRDVAVVVGDIAGHDMHAAAIMGQVRSMLRGLALAHPGPPDDTLVALDQVIRRLRLVLLATCVFVQIRRDRPPTADAIDLWISWSNAGHPAPILIDPDGRIRVLDDPHDAALGVAEHLKRASGTHALPRGATLLLFTDGLYERRGIDLDACFELLAAKIAEVAHRPIEEMCDELLGFAPHEDDIALVVLRARQLADR